MPLKRTKIEKELTALAISLGFGNPDGKTISESGTEQFAFHMLDACLEASKNIRRSHREGLCWDAITTIAGYFEKHQKLTVH